MKERRLARCVALLVALIPGSYQIARATQDPAPPLRLRAADDFVIARTSASVGVDVASANKSLASVDASSKLADFEREHRMTPSDASSLAASPAPPRTTFQDPAIPNHPALSDRYYIGLGAYFATSGTEAKLESPSGIGTSVNFEDALGLSDRQWTPQVLARFRMTDNWRLELEYFSLRRDNSTTIDAQIDWGGQTYPINTVVKSKFNIDVTRVSVGYSFFKRPDKELGVAFGLHLTDIEAELSNSTGGQAKGAAALAPLPVFSMYGQFALTDRWALDGRFDVFKLEYDPYQGSVFSLGLDVIYQPWRHVGFGLGYRSLDIDAQVDKSDWKGSINSSYQGPIAFICASF